VTVLFLSAALSVVGSSQKPEPKVDEKIAAAREKAVVYLKQKQHKDGHWEEGVLGMLADMDGGFTGLATLALLEAGVPANDPAVVKAVEYLVKLEPKKTYVVSLQTQVLCRMKDKKHLPQIQKNADWLLEKAVRKGDSFAGWSYPAHELADGSNTHFAVVALHTAAQAGAKVDGKVWEQVRDLYARTQTAGGWGYYSDRALGGDRVTYSMTTCGLLGLTISARYDKNAKEPSPAFEKGMVVLLKLVGGGKSSAYDRFATAELGRELGQAEFKAGKQGRAWYREGAESLLREQREDGSFAGKTGIDANPVLATAFGLYFLGPPGKK
jgi:hypothetical protein